MGDLPSVPLPPEKERGTETLKQRYQAQLDDLLDERKTGRAQEENRSRAGQQEGEDNLELEVLKSYHAATLDAAKASVDRRRAGAAAVQGAATAIAALYTGVVGLAFSVSDRPLPWRGILPEVFLGLAVVLATMYLAYHAGRTTVPGPAGRGSPREGAAEYVEAFIRWISAIGRVKNGWLNASLVALAVGLVFLPTPFITFLPAKRPTAIHWPANAKEVGNAGLKTILYQAKVDAVKKQRQIATTDEDTAGDVIWIAATLLGLAAVYFAPKMIDRRVAANEARLEAQENHRLPALS
jgi:hypothetical protein